MTISLKEHAHGTINQINRLINGFNEKIKLISIPLTKK